MPALRSNAGLFHAGVVGLVGAGLAAGLLVPLPHSLRMTRLAGALDVGHFFGFAVLAGSMVWAWPRGWVLAGPGAMLLACLAEGLQPLFGRTADARDLAFGVLGAAAGWVAIGAVGTAGSWRGRFVRIAASAGLAAWPVGACMPDLLDSWDEWHAFPVLCDFRTPWQTKRWLTLDCNLRRVVAPDGRWAGQFEVQPAGARSAMAVLFPLCGDWHGYRRLVCELDFDGQPLEIGFFVRTGWERNRSGGVSFREKCKPGSRTVVFDFAGARNAGGRPADLSRVHSVYFNVRAEPALGPIRVRRLYLE